MSLVSIQRLLVVGDRRIDITGCQWCGEQQFTLCSVCAKKAEDARREIAQQQAQQATP